MGRRKVRAGDLLPVKTVSMHTQSVLVCPDCGPNGSNLHHGRVTVFNRFREDGPGNRVDVCPCTGVPAITPVDDHEIPGRRNSLRVELWCECGRLLTLHLDQHKGTEYLRWTVGGKELRDRDGHLIGVEP